MKPDLDALGAIGDVGWYCIRGILWAADFELPKSVIALRNPVFNKAGVIISCGASLSWEDGKVASFHCSFLSNLTMDLTAVGTKGTLHLHDFIIPFEEKKASFVSAVESGFKELVTGWEPKPSEHTVMTDIPHEALMVNSLDWLQVLKMKAQNLRRSGQLLVGRQLWFWMLSKHRSKKVSKLWRL